MPPKSAARDGRDMPLLDSPAVRAWADPVIRREIMLCCVVDDPTPTQRVSGEGAVRSGTLAKVLRLCKTALYEGIGIMYHTTKAEHMESALEACKEGGDPGRYMAYVYAARCFVVKPEDFQRPCEIAPLVARHGRLTRVRTSHHEVIDDIYDLRLTRGPCGVVQSAKLQSALIMSECERRLDTPESDEDDIGSKGTDAWSYSPAIPAVPEAWNAEYTYSLCVNRDHDSPDVTIRAAQRMLEQLSIAQSQIRMLMLDEYYTGDEIKTFIHGLQLEHCPVMLFEATTHLGAIRDLPSALYNHKKSSFLSIGFNPEHHQQLEDPPPFSVEDAVFLIRPNILAPFDVVSLNTLQISTAPGDTTLDYDNHPWSDDPHQQSRAPRQLMIHLPKAKVYSPCLPVWAARLLALVGPVCAVHLIVPDNDHREDRGERATARDIASEHTTSILRNEMARIIRATREAREPGWRRLVKAQDASGANSGGDQ